MYDYAVSFLVQNIKFHIKSRRTFFSGLYILLNAIRYFYNILFFQDELSFKNLTINARLQEYEFVVSLKKDLQGGKIRNYVSKNNFKIKETSQKNSILPLIFRHVALQHKNFFLYLKKSQRLIVRLMKMRIIFKFSFKNIELISYRRNTRESFNSPIP